MKWRKTSYSSFPNSLNTKWVRRNVEVELISWNETGWCAPTSLAGVSWKTKGQLHRSDDPAEYRFETTPDVIKALRSLDDPSLIDDVLLPRTCSWYLYGILLREKKKVVGVPAFPAITKRWILKQVNHVDIENLLLVAKHFGIRGLEKLECLKFLDWI